MADLLNCVFKQQLHFMVLILLKTLEKFHTTFRTATPQSIQMSASCASLPRYSKMSWTKRV